MKQNRSYLYETPLNVVPMSKASTSPRVEPLYFARLGRVILVGSNEVTYRSERVRFRRKFQDLLAEALPGTGIE